MVVSDVSEFMLFVVNNSFMKNLKQFLAKIIEFENPIESESLVDVLENIYNWIVSFGIVAASIAMVWAGFLFLSAGGEEEKIEKAKRFFRWAVIGLIICILAKGIVLVIKNLLFNEN